MNIDAESYLKTGSNELRVLEYRISDMSFGINILKVSKIVNKLEGFTSLPGSHPAVIGIFREHDHVIPIVDLANILGINSGNRKIDKLVVTEFFGMQCGFRVEKVDWIHRFKWEDIIDAKSVFGSIDHKYTLGIVKPTEERMVQLLDYETILLDLSPHLQAGNITSYEGDCRFDGKRVLIAEDSPAVRIMMVTEMRELGFEVVETSDGQMAWNEFQKSDFDLVISDVEMPQMDGLALTYNIRQSDKPKTPVIVYSSIGDMGMKARARFLKVDAHVTKLNINLLLETANSLIRGEIMPQSDDVSSSDPCEKKITATIPLD